MSTPQPQFYFGAMSPYSWFAAERIGDLLPQARWHGVLAGAVFKANGRTSWGLTGDRERGITDCDARAAEHGLGPIRWPDPWPTSDLAVARAMAYADRQGQLASYALAAMRLAFLEGADLGESDAVLEAATRVGLEAASVERAIASDEVKQLLRTTTDAAVRAGVFGVPTIVIDEKLYWGDDELEHAASAFALRDSP